MSEAKSTAADVKRFFDMDTKEFMVEWKALSDEDKAYFRAELDRFNELTK